MNQNEKPMVILLTHPSAEHKLNPLEKRLGFKVWNFEGHHRKFLKHKGNFINKDGFKTNKEMAFWGEWEPESYFHKNKPKGELYSQYYHEPFYTNNPSTYYLQNTDPFVFNNDFHYCVCQQHKVKQFGKIPVGSVLMFGGMAGIGKGSSLKASIAMDTVLVIKDKVVYSQQTLLNLRKKYHKGKREDLRLYDVNGEHYLNVTPEYYEICLDKVKFEFEGETLTLYQCENYDTNKEFYSFFPCTEWGNEELYSKTLLEITNRKMFPKLLHGNSKNEFYVKENKMVKSADGEVRINAQNYPCLIVENIEPKVFWNMVKEEVLKQNRNLGVYAELPPKITEGPAGNYWKEINDYL